MVVDRNNSTRSLMSLVLMVTSREDCRLHLSPPPQDWDNYWRGLLFLNFFLRSFLKYFLSTLAPSAS